MADHPRQHGDVFEGRAGEVEVRDVGISLDGGMVDLPDETRELVHAARDRVLERLELDHELDGLRLGVLGELADVLDHEPEDLFSREHLQIAVVLADHEQHVAPAEVRLLVDVGLAAIEREAAHGRREVDEPECDAHGRADRQAELRARLLDHRRSSSSRRQRILEDVVGVEADLLRLRDALEHAQRRPVPSRTDQPELECVRPSVGDVRSARSRELVCPRRPEELGLEAAAIAPVQADEVLDRPPVLEVRDTREREDR